MEFFLRWPTKTYWIPNHTGLWRIEEDNLQTMSSTYVLLNLLNFTWILLNFGGPLFCRCFLTQSIRNCLGDFPVHWERVYSKVRTSSFGFVSAICQKQKEYMSRMRWVKVNNGEYITLDINGVFVVAN